MKCVNCMKQEANKKTGMCYNCELENGADFE